MHDHPIQLIAWLVVLLFCSFNLYVGYRDKKTWNGPREKSQMSFF